jgi:hypothetical protein
MSNLNFEIMKRLKKNSFAIIATFMLMGFVSTAIAQVPQTPQTPQDRGTHQEHTSPQDLNQQTLPEDQQQQRRSQEKGISPQEQNQLGEVDYSSEIEEAELPATVTTSLETRFPDHDIEKVYKGDDNSYKIKVKNGDKKSVVYYDANGVFVKEDDQKDKDKDKGSSKDKSNDW